MYQLGELQILRAVESEVPIFDTYTFFPDATKDVIEANRDWLMPRYIDPKSIEVILCIQSYIIKTSHHTILVDTCVGNHKPRPARPSWHMQDGPFLAELAAVGVVPEEVDFVLCTHLHVDHVGWNTQLINGKWVPTFPNAKYIFSRNEFELWHERYSSGAAVPVPLVYEDSVLPIVEAGQALIVEDSHQIDDGMWLEAAPGHTPGHVIFYHPESKLAAVGDVLFRGSIGRTDLPRGNHQDLLDSITKKLWPLGEEILFISGHGPVSTFGQERKDNAFVADSILNPA